MIQKLTNKMTKKAAFFLRISALILSAYAVAFLVYPELLGQLVGFTHHSPNTLVEVTAFYGGLGLGLAIFLIWSAAHKNRIHLALMMIFFVFMAAGIAQLVGIIRFGFEDPSQPIVTILEISWALISVWLARNNR
ncbi:MAG: DUF4345 family protein [Balneolaceae bacterium]|nr:DUF4345 family protein [Balneolaceae bacterium]